MHKLVRGGFFGGGGVDVRLHRATLRLSSFCKASRKRTALRKFSQDNLCLKKGVFPDA